MDKIGEWQIEKYGRTTVRAAEEGKEWETLDNSPTRPLVLILTKVGILTVQVGRLLLEYWNLLQVKDMKIYTRGDCMLFLCKAKEDVRKWRVKFAGGAAAGEKRCATCARAVDTFLVSTTGHQPALPTASLLGLQPASPAASLPGFQPALPALSLPGLHSAPATSVAGFQPYPLTSPALPAAPALPRRPVPILAGSAILQQPPVAPVALSHASGIYPSNQTLSHGRYTLTQPVTVSSSSITQDYLTTPATALTSTGNSTLGCVGNVSAGEVVLDTSDLAPGGKSARLVTQGSSGRDPTTQDSFEAGGGTDPAKVARASSQLETLGDPPNLEQLVRVVLQDPRLPDLVDAVHRVISDM